jgi:RNA polymerase sigma-70 factor (ECF subfamily)
MTQPRPDLPPPDREAGSRPTTAEVFDELVQEHYERLCNFAFRLLGSREVAEDIVHDVFLQIWRQRDSFEFREPLAYLYRAVRNRAAGHHRHEMMRTRVLAEVLGPDEPVEPSDSVEQQEARDLADAVARAVETLPRRCRLIFTMSREQGLTYAQIADALDLSVKTVEAQMNRAFKLLRARVSGYLGVAVALASAAGTAGPLG